jgi:hypothetical protein
MNSFKKIAIATVAAVTMATLVATPASAATALSVGGSSVSTGLTASNPVVLPVPADNSVDSADALRIALTGIDTGTVVSAVASNASIVPALATVSAPVTASAGTSSLSINTGTGTTADFYVFTKTVNAGTVIVTIGGNTTTYYLKGSAGAAYNLSVVAADTANVSSINKVYVKTTDAFGNPVVTSTPAITVIGATAGAVSVSDTVTGTFAFDLTAPAATGNAAFTAAITATDVVGFAAAAKSATRFIAITSAADALALANAQIASLTAQLAAEKSARATEAAAAKAAAEAAAISNKAAADLAKAAYVAEYNALAKRWNAKNPKAKVALKK